MAKIHCMKTAICMAVLFSIQPAANADDLETRVAQLEKMVNARNLSQIEMQQQIDSLTQEVRSLRGSLDESNYKLQQATDRQKSLYEEIDKLQQAPANPAPATQPQAPTQAAASSADAPASASQTNAAANPQATATPTAPASGSETKDYENAVNLVLKDKKYDQAIPAFEGFISSYPSSASTPNAYYWLGQLYLNKGNKEKAKANFLTVAQKFKDSPKRAEAIYKLGVITKSEGDIEKANKYFDLVVKQYPTTSAAQLAKKAISG